MATDKKLVRSKSGLRMVAVNESLTSPLMLSEPLWVPDNECSECMSCKGKFGYIKRRHHCRRCGKCFCGSCCEVKISLPRMCFVDPVRQCRQCIEISHKEKEFFERHLKILTTGALFHVDSNIIEDCNNAPVFLCKLTTDNRFLSFDCQDNNNYDLDTVELCHIEGVQILKSGSDPQGNAVATGITVKFRDPEGVVQTIELNAVETSQKRQAMVWVAALQKAMKLIYSGRNTPVTST